MPEQATNAAAATAAKKKRNRKKKKNTNKDASKEAPATTAAVVASNPLNPHTLMRDKLITQDFTGEQVDKAMEDMWNMDLAYDEYDAVLEFLKGGGKKKEEAGTKNTASKVVSSTARVVAPAATVAAPKAAPIAATSAATPSPPTSMAARLDLVAGFENLADAAFALTEWVAKVAKTHELDEFCAGTKTKALQIVFSRAVTDDLDAVKFESSVLPAISRLVFSIFQKAGLTPEGVASAKDSMEACLLFARKLALTTTTSSDFGPKMAQFLASRIAVTVDEAKLALSGGSANIQRLQNEIDAIVKSLAIANGSSGRDVTALIAKRDKNQSAAKKASMVARMAFSTLSSAAAAENGFAAGPAISHRDVDLTKSDILLALVGVEGKQKLDDQRTEYNAIKTKVESTDSNDVKKMPEDLEGYQSEREIIASRIAELKLSIEKLEIYDAELTSKIIDFEATLEKEAISRSAEMENLSVGLEEKQKATKFGNSLASLVDLLKGYDDTLNQAVQTATSPSKPVLDTTNDSLSNIVSSKMSMFVKQARNYMVAESECVAGLKTRIAETQKDIGDMKIEIAEMEGLGMTTTISQMEQTIVKKERLILEDTAAIERSTLDAAKIFDTLIVRMEAYNLARAAEELAPIDPSSFQGIPSCIESLQIPNGDRLNSIVDNGMLSLSPPKKQQPTLFGSGAVADIPPAPMPALPGMTAQATSVPKFTWAASKPAAPVGNATSGKPSFLDIQKEELKSKGADDHEQEA